MKDFSEWYEKNSDRIRLVSVIASGICLFASLLLDWTGHESVVKKCDPALVAIVLCGIPIVFGAIVGVVKEHDITADVLVSLALIGSLALKEFFAAGEVAFIMQIGSILEDFTSDRAKKSISKLIKLNPQKANLVENGTVTLIDADNVKLGDVLQVKAGEAIPVDGTIIEGISSVDQSSMTGESVPVEKKVGDAVMSGTINLNGVLLIQAIKTAENSSLQRMIKLAGQADAQKAKIVRKANVWAAWLVVISLTTVIIAGVAIGLVHDDCRLGFARAVTVLVVFCPCAFVLATPTAISAGIGNASRHGILIQSGEALDRIASANLAVFDKTGTLTKGKPVVVKVEPLASADERELVKIAASGEVVSNHPFAHAIIDCNTSGVYEVAQHRTIAGKGIEFQMNGKRYFVGKVEKKSVGCSLVGVYENDVLLGIIYIQDVIKDNAQYMIERLKAMQVKTVMLTGDNEDTARSVAGAVGVDSFISNCSPEDKMNYIRNQELQGNKVAMFGDGVNDSLALRSAFAGIAMGGIGSDVAIESSEAVIVHDNLDAIPYLFKIARKTQKRITINLCISMLLNCIAVFLAINGTLNAVWGALFHNCGSVLVVVSAFLLLFSS
ncbi:MAG: cadmium-translocating P-type ATPase [Treponema sp.]|nr:cadmium-translocating P-type ATPase [Treponema sp.]